MKIIAVIAGAVMLAVTTPALHAADYKVGAIQVSHPWARATLKGAAVGGGYMTITNTGTESDRLVSGASPVADHLEIHQMTMDGNVMRMRQLKDGLEIKPGETVTLGPGSFHLMLVGLKQPIKLNETVKVTLTFANAGSIDIDYPVMPAGATSDANAGQGGMKMNADPGDMHGGMKMK